jgi:hypothetical protein
MQIYRQWKTLPFFPAAGHGREIYDKKRGSATKPSHHDKHSRRLMPAPRKGAASQDQAATGLSRS